MRSLLHSQMPLVAIGVFVYPEVFGLSKADQAFDDAGKIKDAPTEQRLKKLLIKYWNHIGGNNTK